MARVTKTDIYAKAARVTSQLEEIGLLNELSQVIIHEGSSTYGHSWRVFFNDSVHGHTDFLGNSGRLGLTITQAAAALDTVSATLEGVRRTMARESARLVGGK